MSTSSKGYRAQASEYGVRGTNADLINEILEYRGIARRFTEWADGEEAADNRARRPPLEGEHPDGPRAADEDRTLLCLGAALVVTWEKLPEELQGELSILAAAMRERLNTTPLRAQVAQLLAKREDDAREDLS